MKLVILPGFSPINRGWAQELAQIMERQFNPVDVIEYQHWQLGGGLKLAQELDKLDKENQQQPIEMVMAKSVGVYVAMEAVKRRVITPRTGVFMGTTKKSAPRLKEWSLPTLLIQESKDPLLSFAALNKYTVKMKPEQSKLVEVEGNRHAYEDIERIGIEIEKFMTECKLT